MRPLTPNIPNRSWVTEIGLARTNREVRFGTRLTCVTRGDDPPFAPSIPGLVRQLADTIGLKDYDQPILSIPIQVEDGTSAKDLVNLLIDKRRTRPVFAISRTEIGTIINANYLAGQCCGAAHVVVVLPEASFALTDLLGREYSVYRGAIRTYRPGFDPEEDQPSDHPVLSCGESERLAQWGSRFIRRSTYCRSDSGDCCSTRFGARLAELFDRSTSLAASQTAKSA